MPYPEIASVLAALGYAAKGVKYTRSMYDNLLLGGKEEIGEFTIRDKQCRGWKVKVRQAGERGRYLKFQSCVGNTEIKASVDGYKPKKYVSITEEDWLAFAAYSQTEDERLYNYLENILNNIVLS